jgi:hypothetical protein
MYQHPLDAPAAFFRYAICRQQSLCSLTESPSSLPLVPVDVVFLAASTGICTRNSPSFKTGR